MRQIPYEGDAGPSLEIFIGHYNAGLLRLVIEIGE
jgi:hypothetical protein